MTVRTACACASGACVGCCCSSKAVNIHRLWVRVPFVETGRSGGRRCAAPPSLSRLPSHCWTGWRMSENHQRKNDNVV